MSEVSPTRPTNSKRLRVFEVSVGVGGLLAGAVAYQFSVRVLAFIAVLCAVAAVTLVVVRALSDE
jgi:predicted MFS family arabinose efflux permease